MNLPVKQSGTMSSREIAEMHGKQHKDVLKKVRALESAYVEAFGTERKFALSEYKDSTGRSLPEIQLDKSQALFVASRFDAVLHAKVQKRWEDLESGRAALPDFTKPAIAARAWADEVEQKQKLQLEVSELAPKASFHDKIVKAEGNLVPRRTAKALGVREKDLIHVIQLEKFCFRNKRGTLEGYANKIPRFVDHKVHPIPCDADADRISLQLVITPEGMAKLSAIIDTKYPHILREVAA